MLLALGQFHMFLSHEDFQDNKGIAEDKATVKPLLGCGLRSELKASDHSTTATATGTQEFSTGCPSLVMLEPALL